MPKTEITNMVMVQHPETGMVLVQNRIKSWQGIAFPGGHAEPGESIYDSAVREIREETGLTVRHLKSCGFAYWFNDITHDQYFVYFYKTTDFSGTLLEQTDEGRVFFTPPQTLKEMKLAPNFEDYFPMFFEEKYCEAYCVWNENSKDESASKNPWGIIYR